MAKNYRKYKVAYFKNLFIIEDREIEKDIAHSLIHSPNGQAEARREEVPMGLSRR